MDNSNSIHSGGHYDGNALETFSKLMLQAIKGKFARDAYYFGMWTAREARVIQENEQGAKID